MPPADTSSERVHLSMDEARALGERACRGLGYDAEEAWIITDHVLDAALCGYEYSGLAKILNIPDHWRFANPRQKLSIMHETPVSTMFDGGNNVGMVAMYHAAKAVIAKAQENGFGLVGVTNSWMSGRSAYYCEMIARADLITIHTAAAHRGVAPHGGAAPALGTNPIAFGFPASRDPLIFDMGTSAFMLTEAALLERLGKLLPEGVAIDREGRPTRDPAKAREGAMLPFGGYKGFGLALIVAAFGVLARSAVDPGGDDGYVFIAFRPDLLNPTDAFKNELTALLDRVKATPRQPDVDEIRLPSERAFRTRERLRKQGIEIDRMIFDRLNEVAAT